MTQIKVLSCEEVRRVDNVAINKWGFPGMVLMENAGRGVVDVLCDLGVEGSVCIVCAKGNNGGDGLVIARHLHLRGFQAEVILACEAAEIAGDAKQNLDLLRLTQVPMTQFDAIPQEDLAMIFSRADWLVDAMLGTGATGEPREPLASLIQRMNRSPARKLAVDVPTGMDAQTGEPADITFRAENTCTFVAQKSGFLNPLAKKFLGDVHVLDIGLPPELVAQAVAMRT